MLSPPLVLENTAFYTGALDASSFQVSTFNVSVGKGQVLAVCGPVGGGFMRSGLERSLLGSGTVRDRKLNITAHGDFFTSCRVSAAQEGNLLL